MFGSFSLETCNIAGYVQFKAEIRCLSFSKQDNFCRNEIAFQVLECFIKLGLLLKENKKKKTKKKKQKKKNIQRE